MEPKALWKRAAALLAAVGMSIFLAGGISADDENAEAEAARVLKPTQAIAEVPEEYNELFEIQWGGGSLYHLKARLATMGCMLNTIWVYDNNRWFAYNQYNIPHTFNQTFLTQFKDTIPPSTLYATCINICALDIDYGDIVEGGECIEWDYVRADYWVAHSARDRATGHPTIEATTPCTNDFHPLVKERVFSLLPIILNTCIVRQIDPDMHIYGGAFAGYVVLWLNPLATYNEVEKGYFHIQALHTEIHELCHIQQMYYFIQQAKINQEVSIYQRMGDTDAIKEFMKLTGFKRISQGDIWIFELPENSIYKELYSTNDIELSAELCTLYILDKIGEESNYHIHHETFNPQKYLTPEIIQWLETYMVLPYPNAE